MSLFEVLISLKNERKQKYLDGDGVVTGGSEGGGGSGGKWLWWLWMMVC